MHDFYQCYKNFEINTIEKRIKKFLDKWAIRALPLFGFQLSLEMYQDLELALGTYTSHYLFGTERN